MSATDTDTTTSETSEEREATTATGKAGGDLGTLVAHLGDLDEGAMTMVKADGRRICLVRTASGVHAIDNACPHEGYGLARGGLDGELVTCQWHNWKFRVTDGSCIQGEENVRVHHVDIDDHGGVRVTVNRPDPAELLPQLMDSLRRGIEKHYIGQVSRDVIRLLQAGADPAELVWVAAEYGAPRAEYGWGHAIASAADCLSMLDLYDGDEQALPVVQAIAGIAEVERDRPPQSLPEPAAPDVSTLAAFRAAVEAEQLELAQSLLLGALARGADASEIGEWFTAVVSDHLLSYGHGAIYVQKGFELLEAVGWHRAPSVLGHLVSTIVYGSREDLLPYIKPFTKVMGDVDFDALARTEIDPDWNGRDELVNVLMGADRSEPARAVERALAAGAGVDRVLDACVLAASERMLRYDTDGEFDLSDDFGWLDITHGLTYAHAARWHHTRSVAAGRGTTGDLVRLVFSVAFLENWTGRHEWHTRVAERMSVELGADIGAAGDELQRRALLDGTSAFIVAAHAVKTSRAAARESLRLGSATPLEAAARFIDAPKLERFVAANVRRSLDFLNGRTQRD
jgi:nitrite reductase/ring-hydroxylating ferredoxin subunit